MLLIVGSFKKMTTFATENKKREKDLHIPNILSFFALAKPECLQKHIGSLDEWLSQRSAKPCTAVRIRQEPQ